jgi:hypothetical protein
MALDSRIDSDMIRAYRATHYRVAGVAPMTLRVDAPSPALAALHKAARVESSAFVTACNPFSQRCDDPANARRQAILEQELSDTGARFLNGIGENPAGDWAEASFLVLGLSLDAAKALGQRYDQNAVIWAGCDAVPRLVLLR